MELSKKMKVMAVTHSDPRMHVVPPELKGEEIYLVLQDEKVLGDVHGKEPYVREGHMLAPHAMQVPETVVTLTPEEYADLGKPGIDTIIEVVLRYG
ncbi:MAG: hypothetical protein QXV32_07920 [Conexivisphaerales archaeon]